MNRSIIYVGLDYHQKKVQVCAMDEKQNVLINRGIENYWRTIAEAIAPLNGSVQAAIEVGCGAADLAEELVSKAGWSVDLAHPGYVARMKQSPDKSDYTDSRLLADLERVGYVPKVWQAPHYIAELRSLVQYRQVLVNERRNTKLRIRAVLRNQRVLSAPSNPWTLRWQQWLLEEAPLSTQGRWIIGNLMEQLEVTIKNVAEAEARLREYTREDPLVARLCEYNGIGLVTACSLRASVGRFDRFRTGKQLARFCGLSPKNASSGQRQATAGLIGACDRQLRAILIEASHRLIRCDDYCRSHAERLLLKRKPRNVIVAATMNRWLRRLFHTMKPLGLSC